MASFYGRVLAQVHDDRYTDFARAAAKDVVHHLQAHDELPQTVIDAGCGSGVLAGAVRKALDGSTVWGIDVSGDMLDLASERAPDATLLHCDILDVALWPCSVVCAVGEVLNYALAEHGTLEPLTSFFARAYAALEPNGLLLFDAAHPGRHDGPVFAESHRDISVTMMPHFDDELGLLLRDITVQGAVTMRAQETHRLRLFEKAALTSALTEVGFEVETRDHYADVALRPNWTVFAAHKR